MRPSLRFLLRALFVCAALPLAACEHGIQLQGKVSVPGPLKQMFSPQNPGELVVRARIPGQPDITFPSVILCGARGDDAQIIDLRTVKLACAREDSALFSAWVIPRAAHEVSCTAPPESRSPDTQRTLDAVAYGSTVAPVNVGFETPTACKDGSISFALTLEPRR